MYGINPNINTFKYKQNYSSPAFGNNEQSQQMGTPANEQKQETSFLDSMLWDENFDAEDKRLTWLLTAPFMIGLFKLMSLFSWANKGEYDKSFIGRLANFGDKVSNGKIANSPFGKFISSAAGKMTALSSKIVSKSKILTAMFRMPTIPESSQVKNILGGSKEEITNKFISFVNKYVDKDVSKYADLGLSEAQFKAIQANPLGNIDIIKQTCKNVGSKYSLKFDNYLGAITNRKVTLEQIGNELKAITEPTSKLGRFLPKAAIRGLHGLTFGGGLFMILNAFALAKAVPMTQKAEKGDKFPTFMEEFLSNISWVVTMPLGIKLMNAVGGWCNIGMSPARLRKYRKMLDIHNAKDFGADKAAFQKSLDALKAIKKKGKKGFLGTIASWIGSFVATGREVVKPYIKTGTNLSNMDKFKNFLAKSKFYGKKFLGYPIGFLTYMLIFSPIVDKLFVGASHLVFGKPKHSIHDRNAAENKDISDNSLNTVTNSNDANIPQSPSNLLNMKKNGIDYAHSTNSAEPENNKDNYTYIPSTDPVKAEGASTIAPVRTYVPSSEGVKVAPLDPTLANQAMSRADAAEKMALEALAMK